jgi:hypothetical protein
MMRSDLGDDVEVNVRASPSGALGCVLRVGEKRVVMDVTAGGEWWVDDEADGLDYRVSSWSMTEALDAAGGMLGRMPVANARDGGSETAGNPLVAKAPWLMIDGAGEVTAIIYTACSDLVALRETFVGQV